MTTLYPQNNQTPVRITFEKVHPNAKAPTRASAGAAGWDLYACEDASIYNDPIKVRTGIRLIIPEGYEAQFRSRSGLALHGVLQATGVGTIDSDYRGEICSIMYTLSGPTRIHEGERIGQLIIAPVPKVEFVEGVVLVDTDRGEGGFGSSGK